MIRWNTGKKKNTSKEVVFSVSWLRKEGPQAIIRVSGLLGGNSKEAEAESWTE